jgi:hypothetical protein
MGSKIPISYSPRVKGRGFVVISQFLRFFEGFKDDRLPKVESGSAIVWLLLDLIEQADLVRITTVVNHQIRSLP